MESMSAMSQQLAELADRLRESISRFAVATMPFTRELHVPDAAAPIQTPPILLEQ
jgi:hypothetical protein